ncbi:MAG: TSUP family transporter, partial [Desulfomonilaceae bacterium]
MSWNIYLPIAGASVNIFLLLGLGGVVGFLSGLFGVGGGFLMTPLLIMAGIPPLVAAASDSNQIVAASTSATYAHYRMGNVDFKMGALLLIGGVVGGGFGVQLIKILRAMGNADFVIKITYVVMLGVVGSYMFMESLQSLRKASMAEKKVEPSKPSLYVRTVQALPFQMK